MQVLKIPSPQKPIFSALPTRAKVEAIASWLTEKKSGRLVAFDLSREQSLTEAAIVVTASSVRHAQGLADFVLESCKKSGFEILRAEGYQVGQWILLDLNDVVAHIFQPDARNLYRLEDLWPAADIIIDQREAETP